MVGVKDNYDWIEAIHYGEPGPAVYVFRLFENYFPLKDDNATRRMLEYISVKEKVKVPSMPYWSDEIWNVRRAYTAGNELKTRSSNAPVPLTKANDGTYFTHE